MSVLEAEENGSAYTSRDFADEKPLDQKGSVMGPDKSFPPDLPEVEAFVVEFDGHGDIWLPYNWPSGKKCVFPSMPRLKVVNERQ